jgi:hypothetical protein
MRSLYEHTIIFPDSGALSSLWRKLQIQAFTLLSSSNAFLGCSAWTRARRGK